MTLPIPNDGEWLDIPGTQMVGALATPGELGAAWSAEVCGAPTSAYAWQSLGYDHNLKEIHNIRPGGHADWAGADSYRLRLLDTVPAWVRSEPVQHLTVETGQVNSLGQPVCNWPTYGPPSQHTYGGVVYLGSQRYLHMGSPGGCKGAVMNPGNFAYFVDVSTDPFTWIEVPALHSYAGVAAAALEGQYIYVVEDKGKWAKIDKDTGALVANGIIGAAKVNGVTMSGFSSFGAQMSGGEISNGIFCTGNSVAIGCSDINGTNPDAQNDTRFGKFIRRSFGAGFANGRACITKMPDGWFALWQGGKDVWLFKPDFTVPANDQWLHYQPATGPTPQNAYIYQKLFWDETDGVLVGNSNVNENVWVFKVPGFGAAQQNGGGLSFDERRAGALFSHALDTQPPTGTRQQHGVFMNGGLSNNQNPVMPHVEPDGWLHMEFLSNSNAGAAGQYWATFEDVMPGESLFVQWQAEFNEAFVKTELRRWDNGGRTAPKLIIVSEGNSSNSPQEVTITTTTTVPRCLAMYNDGRFFEQIPRKLNWIPPVDELVTINLSIGKAPAGYPVGSRVRWDTYIGLHVKHGDKIIEVVNTVKPCLTMDRPHNSIFITQYVTKKDPAQAHDTIRTKIKNVIVSKQPIPFP
jgi:hypothetical protein